MEYVEKNCTIEHEGRTYEASGAYVSLTHIVAYPAKDGVLTDWHGKPLGTWREVARWRTPRSYVSSHMLQIEATVVHREETVTYTGRGAGVGMIYKGRRKV